MAAMLGDVLDWAGRLLGLNSDYFDTFEPVGKVESIDEAARRLTLQRWGYNTTTKQLIPGGYFEALFNRKFALVHFGSFARLPCPDYPLPVV